MWILLSVLACSPSQQPSWGDGDLAPFGPSFQPVLNPLQTELRIDASDPSPNKYFGAKLTRAGDLNGDGYEDLAIGAGGDTDRGYYAGAAYIYYGTATGLDPSAEHKLLAPDGEPADYFGQSMGGGGDVDGDGYQDLLVGAHGADDGAFYVFYGSASGVSSERWDRLQRSWGDDDDHFAWEVVHAGDLNGDSYDDVAVSAHGAQSVSLFYGSPSGLAAGREAQLENPTGLNFAYALAGGLDVNADGYGDLLVADKSDHSVAHLGGLATLYFGSASGLSTTSPQSFSASDVAAADAFGVAVVGLGDANGDGYDDVAVASSATVMGPQSGAAYVYYGSASGLDLSSEVKLSATDGASGDNFGLELSSGDWDGDGYSDLAAGSMYSDGAERGTGTAYVYFGSATGIDQRTEVKLSTSDGSNGDLFGMALTAVDLNQDGHTELIAGAPYADSGSGGDGAAYVYQGGCRDQDEDGVCTSEGDCLDLDASAYPGAVDLPGDGVDSDCDGQELCFADPDGDGFGDGTTVVSEDSDCADPGELGTEAPSGDCDPNSGSVFPGAEELIADGIDQDCDGGDLCYADSDADGFADQSKTQASTDLDCEDETEASATQPAGDCADDNPAIHPDAVEICDGLDNDCDDAIDLNAVDQGTWYPDVDEDGFGDPERAFTDCFAPFAYIEDNTDCDDGDPQSYPGAPEIEGDGVDQDCDGADASLPPEPKGCSCSSTQGPAGIALWPLLVLLGGLVRRRS